MFQYHIIANLTQFLKGKDVSFVCFETTPIIFLCMMSSIHVKVHTIKEAWNRRHRYVLSKPYRTPLTLTHGVRSVQWINWNRQEYFRSRGTWQKIGRSSNKGLMFI